MIRFSELFCEWTAGSPLAGIASCCKWTHWVNNISSKADKIWLFYNLLSEANINLSHLDSDQAFNTMSNCHPCVLLQCDTKVLFLSTSVDSFSSIFSKRTEKCCLLHDGVGSVVCSCPNCNVKWQDSSATLGLLVYILQTALTHISRMLLQFFMNVNKV